MGGCSRGPQQGAAAGGCSRGPEQGDVCMCVRMRLCVRACVHAHVDMCVCVCLGMCMCVCICTYAHHISHWQLSLTTLTDSFHKQLVMLPSFLPSFLGKVKVSGARGLNGSDG